MTGSDGGMRVATAFREGGQEGRISELTAAKDTGSLHNARKPTRYWKDKCQWDARHISKEVAYSEVTKRNYLIPWQ